MRIAVISDLHLGFGASDDFGHDDAEFLKFLSFLEREFEKVVLLGDIWETLTGKMPGDPMSELRRVRESHSEIARRFTKDRYLYVHGNHDMVAGATGVPDRAEIRSVGTRILFVHGHQHDPMTTRWRWLSELGVWIGGWAKRVGLSSLYEMAASADEGRYTSENDGCEFRRKSVVMAHDHDVDVVVTGHTHNAAKSEHGSVLFLNGGSCSDGRISFVAMDTSRGSYELSTSY